MYNKAGTVIENRKQKMYKDIVTVNTTIGSIHSW